MALNTPEFDSILERLKTSDPAAAEAFELLHQELARERTRTREVLKRLEKDVRHLDDRTGRLWESAIFRTLRKVGPWLGLGAADQTDASQTYAKWIARHEADLPSRQDQTSEIDSFPYRPCLNVLADFREQSIEQFGPLLQSLREQSFSDWRLFVRVSDGGALETSDHRVTLLPETFATTSLEPRTPYSKADYLVLLQTGAKLLPHAFYRILQALQEDARRDSRPVALYADSDQVDVTGLRQNPLFLPDWSSELLEVAAYPGPILVVEAEFFQDYVTNVLPGSWQSLPTPRDLLRHGATTKRPIVHIPYVLWSANEPEFHAEKPAPPIPIDGSEPLLPLVSIVICSRNAELLDRCLTGIESRTDYSPTEVIVVQHITGDDSAMDAVIQQHGSKCVSYRGPFNFSTMNNHPAESANGEFLLFLNDDTEPLQKDWLTHLVRQGLRPEIGAVGAKLLYPDDTIQHCGIAIGITDGAGHPGRLTPGSTLWPWLNFRREVSAVTGACLLMRRRDFLQMGGFDEVFAVNYNDVDLCLRIRKRGFRVLVEPRAMLRHYECQTRQPGTRFEEREIFWERWGDVLRKGDPFYSPHFDPETETIRLRP